MNEDNQAKICKAVGAIESLVEMLSPEKVQPEQREQAAAALRSLAANKNNDGVVIKIAKAIPLLVEMLRLVADGNLKVQEAGLLKELARKSPAHNVVSHRLRIAEAENAIPLLARLLETGSEEQRYQAAAILRELTEEESSAKIVASDPDAIRGLVKMVPLDWERPFSAERQKETVFALCNLSCHYDGLAELKIIEAEDHMKLTILLVEGELPEEVKVKAVRGLHQLLDSSSNSQKVDLIEWFCYYDGERWQVNIELLKRLQQHFVCVGYNLRDYFYQQFRDYGIWEI